MVQESHRILTLKTLWLFPLKSPLYINKNFPHFPTYYTKCRIVFPSTLSSTPNNVSLIQIHWQNICFHLVAHFPSIHTLAAITSTIWPVIPIHIPTTISTVTKNEITICTAAQKNHFTLLTSFRTYSQCRHSVDKFPT